MALTRRLWLLLFSAMLVSGAWAAAPCTLDVATGTTIDAQPFLIGGYCLRWNFRTGRIAFMQPDASGYYRVFSMAPDGTQRVCLTDHTPGLPGGHHGAEYWHPSGRWLVLEAQKSHWTGRKLFGVPDYEAIPGYGRHDDLWLIDSDGNHCWQLTSEPNTKDEGCLIPVFSPDGKKLAWSEGQPGGRYHIKIADFAATPQPHLEHTRDYQPGGAAYYEPGSFSSDSQNLVYTSDQDTHNFWASQIYRMYVPSGKSTRLTRDGAYNEHPTVVKTPSGDWVVYMSTRGEDRHPRRLMVGTDWWAMRLDGSGNKRLTSMNVKNSAENAGVPQVAGTVAISPNGEYMLGDVQDSLTKQTGLVRTVHFTR